MISLILGCWLDSEGVFIFEYYKMFLYSKRHEVFTLNMYQLSLNNKLLAYSKGLK